MFQTWRPIAPQQEKKILCRKRDFELFGMWGDGSNLFLEFSLGFSQSGVKYYFYVYVFIS